ncbi:MAG: MBL fold metallo-hydrolase [Chloroflexota bacterium]
MRTQRLSSSLSMINPEPPVTGWQEFVSVYVLGNEYKALIDVGPRSGADAIIEGLKELEVDRDKVSCILLTHVHIDHAGATGDLLNYLPNAKVIVHPKGAPHLADPEKLWQGSLKTTEELAEMQGRPQNVPQERISPVEEGTVIRLGNDFELEVVYTPGHASHHMSFLERNTGMLFAGEAGGIYVPKIDLLRPATPPPLRLDDKLSSIDELLQHDTSGIYYAHFGPQPDAPKRLKEYREMLKLWFDTISKGLTRNLSPDEMLSELISQDGNLATIDTLPAEEYQRERYFLTNAVKGFMQYIQKQ